MNPIRDGIILVVYEVIVIICYIVLSSPFMQLITALGVAGSDVSQMSTGVHYAEVVFMMVFALAALIPVIWFIFRVYSREPDWGYRYY